MKYKVYRRIARECGKRDLVKIDITEDPQAYQAKYPSIEFAFVEFGQKIGQHVQIHKKRC